MRAGGFLKLPTPKRQYGMLVKGEKRSRIDQKEDLGELRYADSFDPQDLVEGVGIHRAVGTVIEAHA